MVSIQLAMVALAAVGGGETVLLDFHADWCGPCRQMDAAVSQMAAAGYPVRKINIDQQPALKAQFRVEGIPCFVLLVDGREVDRQVGATSPKRLRGMFQQAGLLAKGGGQRPSAHASPAVSVTTVAASREVPLPRGPRARAQSPDTFRSRLTKAPAGGPAVSFAELQPFDPSHAAGSLSSADQRPAALEEVEPARGNDTFTSEPAAAPGRQPRDAFAEALLAASVRLKIEDQHGHSWGSGTIIDAQQDEALVLTCGHVFRDSQGRGRITVDLFGPQAAQSLTGELLAYDLKTDVGLIRVDTPFRAACVPLAPAHATLQQGDTVISVGCANGGEPTVLRSRVTSLNKYLGPPNIQVAGQPVEGRSGGGLFSADGHLIGVCNAADPADNEGLYAARPSIYAALDKLQLTHLYQERDTQTATLARGMPPLPSSESRPVEFRPSAAASSSSNVRARAVVADAASVGADAGSIRHEEKNPWPQGTLAERGRGPLSPFVRELETRHSAALGSNTATAMPAVWSHGGDTRLETSTVGNPAGRLNDNERAALAALGEKREYAEVVCVIRPLADPQAKSEIIVLDRASPEFLDKLASEQHLQQSRHLTSLNLPARLKPVKRPAAR